GSLNSHLGIPGNPTGNRSAIAGLGNSGLHTSMHPGAINNPHVGGAGANRAGSNLGVHVPFAGRVTPQHLNNFLSMPNHNGVGGVRNGTFPVSHVGGINNSFNHINVNQLNRINTNINNGFRGFNHNNFNRGFGFNRFGFGFGSPYFYNWGLGIGNYWNPYG